MRRLLWARTASREAADETGRTAAAQAVLAPVGTSASRIEPAPAQRYRPRSWSASAKRYRAVSARLFFRKASVLEREFRREFPAAHFESCLAARRARSSTKRL